jgi:hypothetical protein
MFLRRKIERVYLFGYYHLPRRGEIGGFQFVHVNAGR